jgi:hypothetical protein
MIAIWVAAALQVDWSEYRRERELVAEDVEELRGLLDAWGDSLGVAAFRGFGRAARIEGGRELPVYRVRVTTLEERRELAKERRPYEKSGTLVRAPGDVDLQKPPLPPFSGFESRQWRVPVEGSAQTLACPRCGADGRVACPRCQSRRTLDCERCRGAGKAACPSCGGTSKIRCGPCGGGGTSGMGSKRRACSWCSGSGKRSCGSCTSGKARCEPCRGGGQVDCGTCRGRGDQECGVCEGRKTLVETLDIVISLRPRVRETTVTLLPKRWVSLVPAKEEAAQAESPGLERMLDRIPDPELAAAAKRTVEESSREAGGRARGTRLTLQRGPCVLATLVWDDQEFMVARIGSEIHFDASPAAGWAEREARRAEALYASDREEAKRVAAAALRADPEAWRARRLLNAIESVESEGRARLEQTRRDASFKHLMKTCLFTLAGVIGVTMLLLKIYVARRRLRRPAA